MDVSAVLLLLCEQLHCWLIASRVAVVPAVLSVRSSAGPSVDVCSFDLMVAARYHRMSRLLVRAGRPGPTTFPMCALTSSERGVLVDVYSSLGGASWTQRGGWSAYANLSNDPCANAWYGVTCSGATPNRVAGLSLVGVGIIGTFPSTLTQLTQLALLNMSSNAIGLMPTIVSKLSSLTYGRPYMCRISIVCSDCCLWCMAHVTISGSIVLSTELLAALPAT